MPLSGERAPALAEAYAGPRGQVGRIDLPEFAEISSGLAAEDFLIEAVHANPGEVTIVAIGPQTNLARALQTDPSIATEIASVVFMGGGLGLDPEFGRGNVTPVAECNIYFDPEAADMVFRSGIPLTMVGLDVTNPNTGLLLTADMIAGINRGTNDLALFGEICDTYLESPMFQHGSGCVLYDPLAVAVAADPGLGEFERMSLSVETQGSWTRGQTVPTRQTPQNVDVMVQVDGVAVVRDILTTITSRNAARAKL
jgi:inosine-uridine nucleoside N-ribohydrolase